jgi:tetratricopeptide (TPR) repeat protein
MNTYPYRQDREDIKTLLRQFQNLKNGKGDSYIEEDGFERIIEYYEFKESYVAALEVADYAIVQYMYSASLLLKKAAVLIALKRYSEALDALDLSEVLDTSDYTLYILRTDALLALDRQEEAATLLEDAIHKFDGTERIDLLFELADVYDDYEEFDKIFDCLQMILEQEPDNEEALNKICFWTDFTGRNEESIRLHKKLIDDSPYNSFAWFNLGAAYQGLKLYEKAIDAYQYAVVIDEKFDFAYRNMADAMIRIRNYKDAIEALEKVLELSRPEAVIYEAIGHCYDKLNQYAQARFNYKKACHLEADDSHLYYRMALTYMNEQSWKNALKYLETAVKIDKHHPEYKLAMGRCFIETGDYSHAIVELIEVVNARPKNINGWVELLNALISAELYEDALEHCEMAYTLTDKKTVFLYYTSAILFAIGNKKEGLEILETALQINPKHLKKFVEMAPSVLQMQAVIDLIARYKKRKTK